MLNEIIFNTNKELAELKEEIKDEMDRENVPEDKRSTQFVNLFTGSMDLEFSFKDE